MIHARDVEDFGLEGIAVLGGVAATREARRLLDEYLSGNILRQSDKTITITNCVS